MPTIATAQGFPTRHAKVQPNGGPANAEGEPSGRAGFRCAGDLFLALIGDARAEPVHLDGAKAEGVISIVAPSCETLAFSSGEFRRLLAIELAAEHLRLREPAAEGGPAPSLELVLDVAAGACQSDARDVVIAIRADRSKPEQRSVAVSDIAAVARTRALALAAAELIRESTRQWKEATALGPPVNVVPKPWAARER